MINIELIVRRLINRHNHTRARAFFDSDIIIIIKYHYLIPETDLSNFVFMKRENKSFGL